VIDHIPVGWIVAGGARAYDEAKKFASSEPSITQIVLLDTLESEIPVDAPEYDKIMHAFRSSRWCVLIPE